jgi:hypothetical protein
LRSTCRPIHLTPRLRRHISGYRTNGILNFPAKIACCTVNPMFVHFLLSRISCVGRKQFGERVGSRKVRFRATKARYYAGARELRCAAQH